MSIGHTLGPRPASLVVATDIASRAYVTAQKPPDAEATSAESATGTGFAVAMSSRDVNVKASGLGDASLRLLAIRQDPSSKGWEYLVGGADKLEWMDASKVGRYPRPLPEPTPVLRKLGLRRFAEP